MGWWGEAMDLTPWTHGKSTICTDMVYAQAVAQKRAEARGIRQKVSVGARGSMGADTYLRLVVSDAECDCYLGGFSPGSFEGPQEHCPVHGRRAEPCS